MDWWGQLVGWGKKASRRASVLVVLCLALAAGSAASFATASLPDDPYSGTPALDPSQLAGPTAPPLSAGQIASLVEEQKRSWEGDGQNREFPDLTAGEATQLFSDEFGGMIAGLTFNPAEVLDKVDQVDKYVGDTAAVVDPQGPKKHALVDSTVPLKAEDGEPVDLSLKSVRDGFEPVNPLSSVSLPGALGDPVVVSGSGFEFSFPGANEVSEARPVSIDNDADKEVAVYPEAHTDADLALAPAPSGIEYMAQIRSTDAPENFPIEIGGEDVALEVQAEGGVGIYRGDEQVGAVSPAISVDANGKPVPTTISVSGNTIAIEVAHRGGDFSYPILMDPIVESWDWWTAGQPGYDFSAWTPTQSGGSSYQLKTSCTAGVTDSCASSGLGLYVNARPGYTFGAGSYGQWIYNVPWSQYGSSNNTYIVGATSNSWRYMHGTAPNTNPYAYIGTHGPGGWTQYKQYVGVGGGGSGNTFAGGASTKQVVAGLGSAVNVTLPTGGWRYLRVAAMIITLDDGNGTSTDPGNPAIWSFDQGQIPAGWLNAHDEVPLSLTGADAGLGVKNIWALSQARDGGWWVGQALSKAAENPNVTCTGLIGRRCPRVVTGTPIVKAGQLANGETPVTMLVTDALGKNKTGSTFNLKVDNRKPVVDLSGDAIDPSNPGVRLVVHASDPSQAGEEDGISGIEKIQVWVGDELVRSEVIPCDSATDRCPTEATREIQLPYQELLKPQAEIRVDVTDHAGNGSNDADPEPYIPVDPEESDLVENTEYDVEQVDGYNDENDANFLPLGTPGATASSVKRNCKGPQPDLYPNRWKIQKRKNGNDQNWVLIGSKCPDRINLNNRGYLESLNPNALKNLEKVTVVRASGGGDLVLGGNSGQTIYGGPGQDILMGQRNNDILIGGTQNDILVGGIDDDVIRGGDAGDLIIGGPGGDDMFGDGGSDVLRGGHGTDRMSGGSGNDTVSFADLVPPGFEFPIRQNGNNYAGAYLPAGFPDYRDEGRGVFIQAMASESKNAVPRADGGDQRIGNGVDFLCARQPGANKPCDRATLGDHFETIIGSPYADVIVGSSAQETIIGGPGADVIRGRGGGDHIFGGIDGDYLSGGNNDNLYGGPGVDNCAAAPSNPGDRECDGTAYAVGQTTRQPHSVYIGFLEPFIPGEQQDASKVSKYLDPRARGEIFAIGSEEADHFTVTYKANQNEVLFTATNASGTKLRTFTGAGCSPRDSNKQVVCTGLHPSRTNPNGSFSTLGAMSVSGGPKNDTIGVSNFPLWSDITIVGDSGADRLTGGPSGDGIVDGDSQNVGNDGSNPRDREILKGLGGDDQLINNLGRDDVYGGDGNDLLASSSLCDNDLLKGNDGQDSAQWAHLAYPTGVYANLSTGKAGEFPPPSANDLCASGQPADLDGIWHLEGSGHNDKLVGNEKDNRFLARGGTDYVYGNAGSDLFNMNDGNLDGAISCGVDNVYDHVVYDAGIGEWGNTEHCGAQPKGTTESRYSEGAANGFTQVKDAPVQPTSAVDPGDDELDVVPPGSTPSNPVSRSSIPSEEGPDLDTAYALNGFQSDPTTGQGAELPAVSSVLPSAVYLDSTYAANVSGAMPDPETLVAPDLDGGPFDIVGDGESIELGGDGDRIDVGYEADPGLAPNNGFSVEAWVAFDDNTPSGDEYLFSRGDRSNGTFLYRNAQGRLVFETITPEGNPRVVSWDPVTDTDWHHVVGVLDGDQISLYVDGFAYSLGFDSPTAPAPTPSDEGIVGAEGGAWGETAINSLDGSVDEVAFYDDALDEAEVLTNLAESLVEPDPVVSVSEGDVSTIDTDSDDVPDQIDNCANQSNPDQIDYDGDGYGDSCDAEEDIDGDEIPTPTDNCPLTFNPDQEDLDLNQVGDLCEEISP